MRRSSRIGACFPSLADAGSEDPFADASPALRLYRVPSMHGPGDNQIVIDGAPFVNHMAPGWIVLPHHLLGETPITFDEVDFSGHGTPLTMPALRLHVVSDDGGTPCDG